MLTINNQKESDQVILDKLPVNLNYHLSGEFEVKYGNYNCPGLSTHGPVVILIAKSNCKWGERDVSKAVYSPQANYMYIYNDTPGKIYSMGARVLNTEQLNVFIERLKD